MRTCRRRYDAADEVSTMLRRYLSSMPFSLVEVFYGVYAGNLRGLEFVAGPSRTNWRGPPIIGFAVTPFFPLPSTDRNIPALQTLAERYDAPLLIVDRGLSPAVRSFLYATHMSSVLLAYGGEPATADASGAAPVALTGPFIAVQAATVGGSVVASAQEAWSVASDYQRTTWGHPYKIGMQAVSHFGDFDEGPPVYVLPASSSKPIDTYVKELGDRWSGKYLPIAADYALLAAADTARPGLQRRTNAVLASLLQLTVP